LNRNQHRLKEHRVGTIVIQSCRELGRLFQKLGPYLLIELLLPGGTLVALILFLYQRRDTPVPKHLQTLQRFVVRSIDAVRASMAALAEPYRVATSFSRWSMSRGDGLEPLSISP
jgi:hypothetical protein